VLGRLILLVAVLLGLLWLLHWFRCTPPERVSRALRKAALWGGGALLLAAVLTGRLNPLIAALGAAVPAVIRLANLLRMAPALRQILQSLGLSGLGADARAGSAGQASRIRTRYLEVRLDHATGELSGRVLDGPFKGRELSALRLDELLRMHELYRERDAQSLAVLETYLDREHGSDWREQVRPGPGPGAAAKHGSGLTEDEARSILGVGAEADAEVIRTAHRRLMQRLHPDRGGSDYLAAQINAAKRRLLGD
jgi:hypothetical protein